VHDQQPSLNIKKKKKKLNDYLMLFYQIRSYLFVSTNVSGQETSDFIFFPVAFAIDRSVGRGERQQGPTRFGQ
jgi:hypothetical protein